LPDWRGLTTGIDSGRQAVTIQYRSSNRADRLHSRRGLSAGEAFTRRRGDTASYTALDQWAPLPDATPLPRGIGGRDLPDGRGCGYAMRTRFSLECGKGERRQPGVCAKPDP